jgi:hypothetical protein
MASQWLTTSQAARALGISDRQARRYAARLSSDDRREADTASGSRPAHVRLEAMKALRASAKGEQLSVNEADAAADMKADTRPAQGGHDDRPMTGPMTATLEMATAREVELKEEIHFLRSTIEQHQRSEAELRASLREALRAMPKQLEQGKAPEAAATAPEAPTASAISPDGDLPSNELNDLDSLIHKLFK